MALALAREGAGKSIAARMAIMAMTTNSSIRVKAFLIDGRDVFIGLEDQEALFRRDCKEKTNEMSCPLSMVA